VTPTPGLSGGVLDDQVVLAYDVATVDDFLRAVEREAERLRGVIEHARAREARARSLLALHETMVATMHHGCREVSRRQTAARAALAAPVPDTEARPSR
jgi:hypothetical protein